MHGCGESSVWGTHSWGEGSAGAQKNTVWDETKINHREVWRKARDKGSGEIREWGYEMEK